MAGTLSDPNSGSNPNSDDLRWWLAEDDTSMANVAFAAARAILQNNLEREEIVWRNVRMYSGQTREQFWGESGDPMAPARPSVRSNRNVIASIAETMTATLSATPIKSTILSSGGDYSRTRKRSKTAEKFANGVKYNNKFEAILGPKVLLTSLICDLGILKIFEDSEVSGSIRIETVFPVELIVDELDGREQKPRQIMQRKLVPREVLKDMYPEYEEDIDNAPTTTDSLVHMSLSDKIEVLEAWHLPSGPAAGDGKHIICLDGTVLFEEEWEENWFPFVFLRPNIQLFGFFGLGVASDLAGLQYEINQLALQKQAAIRLGSNFVIFVQEGSQVNQNHLVNGQGLIVKYTGDTKPEYYTPDPVSPALNMEIKDLISWGYQRWGVSQLSAQGEKPAGLDSGEALRTVANIESVRHSPLGKAYQQMHLDTSTLILLTARRIAAKREDKSQPFTVNVPDAKRIETISWEDADPGDGFAVKEYATNLFADSPADRLAQIGELVEKGALDMDAFFDLNDYPDLEMYNKIRNAPRDNILKQIDDIVLDKKFRGPEPFQNLQLGLQLFQSALMAAEDDGVDEETLGMLQRWIGEAKAYLTPPPPPPQAPAPGAGPIPPMPGPMMAPPPGAMPPPGMPIPPPPGPAPMPPPMPAPMPAPQ